MYAVVSRFEGAAGSVECGPASITPPEIITPSKLERAEGTVRLRFAADGERSRLDRCYQRGSMKARFPRQHDTPVPEAVLLNTAGGITGGDRFSVTAELDAGAALTLTSQAAERVYRSSGGEGHVDVSLTLGSGSKLAWLPQETILFDGGRVTRTLDAVMETDAALVLCESVILGRAAHGETVREGLLRDRWRVRRGGKLVYADNLTLDFPETLDFPGLGGGGGAATDGAATLAGGRAFASLLIVAPSAEGLVDAARAALDTCPVTSGASAWDGMLAVRLVAADGMALRTSIMTLVMATATRLPRAWSI